MSFQDPTPLSPPWREGGVGAPHTQLCLHKGHTPHLEDAFVCMQLGQLAVVLIALLVACKCHHLTAVQKDTLSTEI